MSLPFLCTSISSTLTHNLRLARSDEQRVTFSVAALEETGKAVFPRLDTIRVEKGENAPDYLQARDAVLELLTFIIIPILRNCTDYRWGIATLDEVAGKSGDNHVRKKLALYSNQLKKKWNEVEPGGIHHSPRAKRIQIQAPSRGFGNLLRISLLLVSALYFFTHFDLTSLIFPSWTEPRSQQTGSQVGRRQDVAVPAPPSIPPQPQVEKLAEPGAGSYYSYTDEQGVVHMLNDLDKVPQHYRQGMKVTRPTESRSNVTPVVIKGDRVFVPVTLSFRGRSVEAELLLDTGATVTTISHRLASHLGVEGSDVKSGTATVADGRSVKAYSLLMDSVAVGGRSVPHVQASILPGSGGDGYDGLLGMNFLKNFRYHVNFSRSVIEWGG